MYTGGVFSITHLVHHHHPPILIVLYFDPDNSRLSKVVWSVMTCSYKVLITTTTLTFSFLLLYYLRRFKLYLNRNKSLCQSCCFGRNCLIVWINSQWVEPNKNIELHGMNSEIIKREYHIISAIIHNHSFMILQGQHALLITLSVVCLFAKKARLRFSARILCPWLYQKVVLTQPMRFFLLLKQLFQKGL